MSIELKQAAQQALLALENSQPHPSNPFTGLTNQDFIDHEETIRQLRAAIQQAESPQPATGEPVKVAPYNPTEEMRWAMKRIDPALSSEQCRALWSAAWSATPEPVARSEREQLRHAQAAVVMPMIGPLLDAWENSDREVMSQEPELSKQLKNINSAMEGADTHPAPSVPATSEPVWCVATGERVNGEETFTHHDAYVPLADCFPLYTHQAPSVPDDMVRDAERYRWLREQNESLESFTFYVGCDNGPDDDGSVEWVGADLDAAIDAAMLAAKERS